MQPEARVTSKGQVTTPRDIRRALRVREGDTLVFEADAQGVRLLQPAGLPEDVVDRQREALYGARASLLTGSELARDAVAPGRGCRV